MRRRMEGSRSLGSPTEKQTKLSPKKFPFEGKGTAPTKPTSASGKGANIKVKDKPHVGEAGKTRMGSKGDKSGHMGVRSAKRPEPDNVPPRRSSAAITPTTKAGTIKQHGSKAAKRLQDVRL